jgi:hypothetical protein
MNAESAAARPGQLYLNDATPVVLVICSSEEESLAKTDHGQSNRLRSAGTKLT